MNAFVHVVFTRAKLEGKDVFDIQLECRRPLPSCPRADQQLELVKLYLTMQCQILVSVSSNLK